MGNYFRKENNSFCIDPTIHIEWYIENIVLGCTDFVFSIKTTEEYKRMFVEIKKFVNGPPPTEESGVKYNIKYIYPYIIKKGSYSDWKSVRRNVLIEISIHEKYPLNILTNCIKEQ